MSERKRKIEKEVKMSDKMTREDLGKKEDSEEELFKQQSDGEDEGNLGEANKEGRVSVTSRLTGQKHLFSIPVDEQIFKLSTGPRSGSGRGTKKRTHRYGTKWLQLQKPPTVCARIEKKLMTEARAKYDENEGKGEKERDGWTKHSEVDPSEDEEGKEELKEGPKIDGKALFRN